MDDRSTRMRGPERVSGFGNEDVRGYAAPAGETPYDLPAEATNVRPNPEEPDQRTSEIRREIEATRGEMSETIDAIQEKLKPRNIIASAGESVRNAATERVKQMTGYTAEWNSYSDSGIMAQVRNNPIPAAMIAVGIAWLAAGRSRNGSRSQEFSGAGADAYPSPYRSDRSTTSERGADVSGALDSLSTNVQNAKAQTAMAARRTTERVQNQFQRALSQNPLLIGAAAAAIGAAVGAALPETERENRLVGDTRDTVVERAQEMARGVAEKVEQTATRVADAAGQAVGTAGKDV